MDKVIEAFVERIRALAANPASPLYYNVASPSATPHGIRAVFFGDPDQIPLSDLPAVVIQPDETSYPAGYSRMDKKQHKVEVRIVDNLRNYSESVNQDARKVQSLYTMVQQMEGTDNNQQTLGTTIAGQIRGNIIMPYSTSLPTGAGNAAILVEGPIIQYRFNISRGFPTFEVIGTFTVTSQGDRAYTS